MHLGKLETSAKNTLKDSVVSTAYADAADCPSGSGDNGCSDDGCGGSGAGDSGGF